MYSVNSTMTSAFCITVPLPLSLCYAFSACRSLYPRPQRSAYYAGLHGAMNTFFSIGHRCVSVLHLHSYFPPCPFLRHTVYSMHSSTNTPFYVMRLTYNSGNIKITPATTTLWGADYTIKGPPFLFPKLHSTTRTLWPTWMNSRALLRRVEERSFYKEEFLGIEWGRKSYVDRASENTKRRAGARRENDSDRNKCEMKTIFWRS